MGNRHPQARGRRSSAGVSVSGLERLAEQLADATSEIHKAVRAAVEESAKAVVKSTQRRVHVDTGNLKRSVAYKMDDGAKISVSIGWHDRDDRYALWQEFGTRAMPARPALAPAFNAEKRKIVRRIGHAIDEVIS